MGGDKGTQEEALSQVGTFSAAPHGFSFKVQSAQQWPWNSAGIGIPWTACYTKQLAGCHPESSPVPGVGGRGDQGKAGVGL